MTFYCGSKFLMYLLYVYDNTVMLFVEDNMLKVPCHTSIWHLNLFSEILLQLQVRTYEACTVVFAKVEKLLSFEMRWKLK